MTPTYSKILQEELDEIKCDPTPDNFRKLLNILANALGEMDRHERRIAQLSLNAGVQE